MDTNKKPKKVVSEEEVQKEFDHEQDQPVNKHDPMPDIIEKEQTGDLSGDVDDTDSDEENEEVSRQEKIHGYPEEQ